MKLVPTGAAVNHIGRSTGDAGIELWLPAMETGRL